MAVSNQRRIVNEMKLIEKNAESNKSMFVLRRDGDDMYHWKAVVYGPEGSLYEGYEFDVDIKLSDSYPNSPPSVIFITPIEHVNVNEAGNICLDILKDKWSSAINMSSILISIASLLNSPNPEDPFNSTLAETYRTNRAKYEKVIKEHCKANARVKQNV